MTVLHAVALGPALIMMDQGSDGDWKYVLLIASFIPLIVPHCFDLTKGKRDLEEEVVRASLCLFATTLIRSGLIAQDAKFVVTVAEQSCTRDGLKQVHYSHGVDVPSGWTWSQECLKMGATTDGFIYRESDLKLVAHCEDAEYIDFAMVATPLFFAEAMLMCWIEGGDTYFSDGVLTELNRTRVAIESCIGQRNGLR